MTYYTKRECCEITFHTYDDYVLHRIEVHGNKGSRFYDW